MRFLKILKRLCSHVENTYRYSFYEHGGNKGTEREEAVIELLIRMMPKRYGFKSGEVFDCDSSHAGQIDIIIYDALHSPFFACGKNIVAPVESTYGIISVKSKMTIGGLDNAIDGIKKYEKLKRPQAKPNQYFIDPYTDVKGAGKTSISSSYQQNINCIFAFDTVVGRKTIVEKIEDVGCVDLLIVPDKFIVFGRPRKRGQMNFKGKPLVYSLHKTKKSISFFVLVLQEYLKLNRLIAGNNLELLSELFSE